MTTRGPEVGDHEVLTFGGEPSPRRPLRLLTVVAAAGLVVGFLAGGRADLAPERAPTSADQERLAVGTVRSTAGGDHPFEVSVHNDSGSDVRVRVAGIPDWGLSVDRSAEVEIAAGAWGAVRFTPGVDCSSPPFAVRSLALLTRSEAGARRTELSFATPSTVLQDHHVVSCTPASTLTRGQLSGVWILDDTDSEESWLADRLLVRFEGDGRFVWDAEGRLFGSLPANRGRYRVGKGLLHLRMSGGTACAPGDRFTWWTRNLPDHRVHLELVRSSGSCAGRPHQVWVLRRLLQDDALPR